MIVSACPAPAFVPFAQQAAQTPTRPFVQAFEDVAIAMLEAVEPSPQRAIGFRDDLSPRAASGALGFEPDGCFDFFQALLAWPSPAPFEVIT